MTLISMSANSGCFTSAAWSSAALNEYASTSVFAVPVALLGRSLMRAISPTISPFFTVSSGLPPMVSAISPSAM